MLEGNWSGRASAPVTNVVAMVVVLVTFLPILAAYYLTRDGTRSPDRANKHTGETPWTRKMLIGNRFEAGTEAEEKKSSTRAHGETILNLPEASSSQIEAAGQCLTI